MTTHLYDIFVAAGMKRRRVLQEVLNAREPFPIHGKTTLFYNKNLHQIDLGKNKVCIVGYDELRGHCLGFIYKNKLDLSEKLKLFETRQTDLNTKQMAKIADSYPHDYVYVDTYATKVENKLSDMLVRK